MDGNEFAQAWCEAWNAPDVERVLLHFHDDAVFASPGALRVQPESAVVVRGKAALRRYWSTALSVIPDLHFTIDHVFAGIDTIVIQYMNQKNSRVSDVLNFDRDKMRFGRGTYPIGLENPVGAKLPRESNAATGDGIDPRRPIIPLFTRRPADTLR